jgi:hypothetical protein
MTWFTITNVNGKCDDSLIHETVDDLGDLRILIKSTVLPDQLTKYPDKTIVLFF